MGKILGYGSMSNSRLQGKLAKRIAQKSQKVKSTSTPFQSRLSEKQSKYSSPDLTNSKSGYTHVLVKSSFKLW
jgi:hypothetical protein